MIAVFAIYHNEELIIQQFIDHYLQIADVIYLFDNESTDASTNIAKSYPKESVVVMPIKGMYDEHVLVNVKEHGYKLVKVTPEIVIGVDLDEFLDLAGFRDWVASKSTVLKCTGYNMSGEGFDLSKIKKGVRAELYDKVTARKLKYVSQLNYEFGCHKANPKGIRVIYNDKVVKLLHYKYIGSAEWLAKRYSSYNLRRSQFSVKHKLSHHYENNPTQEWHEIHTKAELVH